MKRIEPGGIAAKQQLALSLPLRILMIGVSFDTETFGLYLDNIAAYQKEGFYNGQQGQWLLEQLREAYRIVEAELKQVEGKDSQSAAALHLHLSILKQVGQAIKG